MTTPTLEKTWLFDVNKDVSESSMTDTKRHALWQLKESLIGFASSPWSVIASSDSSSVKNIGDASPDLWLTWSNVVPNFLGVAHSWIVLENSVTGEQICLDPRSTSVAMDVVYSATGAFNTDGTITDRPTASESTLICSNIDIDGNATDGGVLHVMITDDGKNTRWYAHFRTGSSTGGWFCCLEEMVNTPAVWTSTHKRCVIKNIAVNLSATNTSKSPQASQYAVSTANWKAYLKDATPYEGWNTCNLSAECYNSVSGDAGIPFYRNDALQTWLGTAYPVSQIGMYRRDVTRGGGLGRFQDIYLAPNTHDTYDTYDGAGSREWIKVGCFLLPWNGTQPLEVP